MSIYDYKECQRIKVKDYSFYALIMAAMLKADSENSLRLQLAFPETWEELIARYNAPGGLLKGEEHLASRES